MKAIRVILLTVLIAGLAGCNVRVNKSVTIDDGEVVYGGRNSVNGNVFIGEDCRVEGSCRSVNGVIEVGENSRVEDLQAVNGRITIDRDVIVDGDVNSVNGPVRCSRGVEIYGDLTTVNGDIDVDGTLVRRNMVTYNGDILMTDRSIVQGDVIVKENKGRSDRPRTLDIEITEESVVEGDIIVRDEDIRVRVYLSDGGRVEGRVRNAEVIEE